MVRLLVRESGMGAEIEPSGRRVRDGGGGGAGCAARRCARDTRLPHAPDMAHSDFEKRIDEAESVEQLLLLLSRRCRCSGMRGAQQPHRGLGE